MRASSELSSSLAGLGHLAREIGRFLERHVAMTVGAGVSTLVISVALTAWMLVRLPESFFAKPHVPSGNLALRIAKNVGGGLLILLGIVLSFPGVPGQGFLTILIGLMLTDLPGKRRIELWVLRRRSVELAISKLRARYGRAPLVLPLLGAPEPSSSRPAGAEGGPPGVEVASADGAAAPAEGAAAARRESTP